MAQISSQSKEDPGYGSFPSPGPERCSRRRRGRGEAEVGSCAPCQLLLSCLKLKTIRIMTLEAGIKGGKESLLKQIRFFSFFPSPHERRQTVTHNEWCESLRQKKPTKPQRVCSLCDGCAAALLHPFPVFSRAHMAGIIPGLFLNCFCLPSCRGAESREQRQEMFLVALPALPSLLTPHSWH